MPAFALNSPNLYFGKPVEEGRKVVAVSNTAVQITSTAGCNIMMVQALLTNAGVVAVGSSSASIVAGSEVGNQMQPGQTWFIETREPNWVYVNGAAADGVVYALLG